MQQILTGIQSSGIPHLGNLLGAIIPAIQATKTTQQPALFFIADLHTLTSHPNPNTIQHYTYATTAAWLACGLDPNQHILYRQSQIPEVCELTWYLSCLTPYPMLANAHAFKSKAQYLASVNAGLFTYPILMAADILLYHATHIPVGKDQQQHLEIARDIAKAFNQKYQQPFFTPPKAIINPDVGIIPGTDGEKMSKSKQNTIHIFDTDSQLHKSILQIKTDSTPLHLPKNPDTCAVFNIYKRLAQPKDVEALQQRYMQPGYAYKTAKELLFNHITTKFKKEREIFHHYIHTPTLLEKILQQGEQKARKVAQNTLRQVRALVGIHSATK